MKFWHWLLLGSGSLGLYLLAKKSSAATPIATIPTATPPKKAPLKEVAKLCTKTFLASDLTPSSGIASTIPVVKSDISGIPTLKALNAILYAAAPDFASGPDTPMNVCYFSSFPKTKNVTIHDQNLIGKAAIVITKKTVDGYVNDAHAWSTVQKNFKKYGTSNKYKYTILEE